MLTTRISQRNLWTSARRFLRPSLCPPSSTPLPPSLPSHSHTFSSSSFAPRSPPFAAFHFNFLHWKSHCFSTQPELQLPPGKIVDVPLAQTGEGIAECELLKWHVQQGDYIEDFQPLCEVQSDKATIEITSRYKGKVAHVLHVPGDIVKVGETLLKILVDETAFPSATIGDSEITKSLDSAQINESASDTAVLGNSNNGELLDSDIEKGKRAAVLSTPAVRSLAKQYGIDINEVCGTGKDGRVLKEDVLNFAVQRGIIRNASADNVEQPQGAQGYRVTTEYKSPSEDTILPLRGYQRAMVKSMSLAAKVPHFHYVDEINCNALVELKTAFQKNNPYPDVKHTFLPILLKSLSMALTKYPFLNSCFKEDSMEVILKGLSLKKLQAELSCLASLLWRLNVF
ncbi:Dihydrolipoamide acetyltransferase component of pyruvate dehydrogenase complex, variant 2 [Stylosanthes scabra]|uniref:Dihydrolipoamide acetyltransferase component of pyruvate dehydrogenase complex n=1 Tax=Stylosanthes scabra TaxID=79078 RepID=A0ABU6Q4Z0_9FABA|nr:Dihydrolipoamide acetyltransferase component of pyruvate dehydrogenase complex, variant 2 [Stylosanthes scabra]